MKLMLLCIIIMYKCNNLSSELISEDEDSGNDLSEKNSKVSDSSNHSNKLASTSSQVYHYPSKIISYVGGGGGFDEEDEESPDDDSMVFQFRRSIKSNTEIEARRRSALDKNFMRFGELVDLFREEIFAISPNFKMKLIKILFKFFSGR